MWRLQNRLYEENYFRKETNTLSNPRNVHCKNVKFEVVRLKKPIQYVQMNNTELKKAVNANAKLRLKNKSKKMTQKLSQLQNL